MALNIKRIIPLDHPDFRDHVHEPKMGLFTSDDSLNPRKDEREKRPKHKKIKLLKFLKKLNVL